MFDQYGVVDPRLVSHAKETDRETKETILKVQLSRP